MKTDHLLSIGAAVLCGSFLVSSGCERPAGTDQSSTPPPASPVAKAAPAPSTGESSAGDGTSNVAIVPPPPSVPTSSSAPGSAQPIEDPSKPPVLAPPPAPPNPSGPPRMEFAASVFDFGRIPETKKHLVRLGFTNFGGETLVINEVKTSCGCTAAQLMKRSYEPGESGHVQVTYKPSAPGEQKQTVNVFTNGAKEPVRLTIQADVEAFLEITPRMLRLGALPYRRAYQTAVAVWSPDESFRIVTVTTSNPNVSARVLPEHEAMRYVIDGAAPHARIVEVEIAPDAPWGGLVSWLDVTISGRPSPGALAITHSSKVRIMADMFGDLAATPNTVRFGAKPGETFERKIRLSRPDGLPLEVMTAVVLAPRMPGAAIAIERVSANETDLIFTATAPQLLTQYNGTVTVRTDVAGEEEVVIPIVGVVRNSPSGVR